MQRAAAGGREGRNERGGAERTEYEKERAECKGRDGKNSRKEIGKKGEEVKKVRVGMG